MARLNQKINSDDEFPELSTLLQRETPGEMLGSNTLPRKDGNRGMTSPTKKTPSITKPHPLSSLKLAEVHSLFLPRIDNPFDARGQKDLENACSARNQMFRSSPRRLAKTPVDYSEFSSSFSDASLPFSEEDESFTDLSGFIAPDSDSEDEVLPSKPQSRRKACRLPKDDGVQLEKNDTVVPKVPSAKSRKHSKEIDLASPKKKASTVDCRALPPDCQTPPRESDLAGGSSDVDESLSRLRFSTPRSTSPHKSKDFLRPVTPPSASLKSRLNSPSKKHRIPPTPHRSSIDAFWSQEVINDWNEQYSPRKVLKTPRKLGGYSLLEDEDELPPSESPRRSPAKILREKTKDAVLRRKVFDEDKHALASSFLAEVDHTVAQGQVASLAGSSGGIKIVWSKKLSSTAGRASWRREHILSKNADGIVSTISYRHHASIELAEKVIDDEDRLMNVIAHEYCHLANFMISGIKDNPHGKEFKEWARKCTKAFSHRNVNVTTKHAYTITYKYIWICSSCGLEYKRHSKSIDPTKHTCGSCKGKLVQVQPAPRKAQAEGKRSDYQGFVKREHERVKKANPGKGFGEIMAILGREYKESKKANVVDEKEMRSEAAASEEKADEDDHANAVMRKLGLMNLDS
ncbi:hypothetical protein N7G274_001948 [Stereocaulon virgatum]|uniref:SprT-like domain-containing protein n=1 Tax=Stereocaulon virgatum TaxID=373712 RepID=A0ABR4AJ89_9LECA